MISRLSRRNSRISWRGGVVVLCAAATPAAATATAIPSIALFRLNIAASTRFELSLPLHEEDVPVPRLLKRKVWCDPNHATAERRKEHSATEFTETTDSHGYF